jgi:hypothetical protein
MHDLLNKTTNIFLFFTFFLTFYINQQKIERGALDLGGKSGGVWGDSVETSFLIFRLVIVRMTLVEERIEF